MTGAGVFRVVAYSGGGDLIYFDTTFDYPAGNDIYQPMSAANGLTAWDQSTGAYGKNRTQAITPCFP